MSDTRVELHLAFTVSPDRDAGRAAAERAIALIRWLGNAHLHDCADFTVTKGPVNGNQWEQRWPDPWE